MRSRRWRRRRAFAAVLAALGVLLAAAGFMFVTRTAATLAPSLNVGFGNAQGIRIVGFSTESAWWLTPTVKSSPGGAVAITVPADVLFAVDSTAISTDAEAALAEVASITTHDRGGRVSVACFTDDTGPVPWNQSLSDARARAVADALVSNGVPAVAITANGFGATDFVATNATPTGRAQNRRCQFTVFPGQ